MAKIFVLPVSTTSDIASGQNSGHLNTSEVHRIKIGKWIAKKWLFFIVFFNEHNVNTVFKDRLKYIQPYVHDYLH